MKKQCPKCNTVWEGYFDESPSNHFCPQPQTRVTMEKPRKKYCSNHSLNDSNFSDPEESCLECYVNREVNAHHDAMSTWLEGEVPTVEQVAYAIREVIFESDEIIVQNPAHNADPNKRYISLRAARKLAGNVHALLTRKLTGKV